MKKERKSPLRQYVNYHLLSLAESLLHPMHSSRHCWAVWENWGWGAEDWYLHTPVLPLGSSQCTRKMQTRKAKSCAVLEYQKQLKVKHPSLMCTRSGKTLAQTVGQLVLLLSPGSKVLSPQRIMS